MATTLDRHERPTPTSLRDVAVRLLHAQPGASTRAIADALGVDESTADYHLRRLRRAGQALSQRSGRELAWFANGSGYCALQRRLLPALRRAGVADLARALDVEARSAASLADRAGLTVGEARWASEVLEACGAAERSASGRLRLRRDAEPCLLRALAGEPCARGCRSQEPARQAS